MDKAKARAVASRIHHEVNSRRQEYDLHALDGRLALSKAAEGYARVVASNDHLSHYLNDSNPSQRASEFAKVSENIAQAQHRGRSVGAVASYITRRWLDSDGHAKNMLRRDAEYDGVGCWIRGDKIYTVHLFTTGERTASKIRSALPV